MSFALDPRLEGDTLDIGDLALSRVRLMNDARFAWLILVPRRDGLAEIVDLDRDQRAVLMEEIALASQALRALPGLDKINVGALGNIVRQLHIHVVARKIGDAAWPGPVWGSGEALRYEEREARERVEAFRRALAIS